MTSYNPLLKVDDGLSGRREYDICIVFSFKTSASVKYGTELDADNKNLKEPTAEEKSVMHMWEMRRNTVLRSLSTAGLYTKCIYSRDRDEIFCKVGASDEKLQEIAQLTKYKLRMKDEYEAAYAEYRKDYVGTPPHYEDRRIVSHLFADAEGSIFRTVDRIRLLDRCIRSSDKGCAAVDMAEMRREMSRAKIAEEEGNTNCCGCLADAVLPYAGSVVDYFPLAEVHRIREFHGHWADMLNPHSKLDQVRDYFGESVAYYWLWIGYMMKSLAVLAFFGLGALLIEMFTQTPNNFTALPFSCLVGVWSVLVVHFWRRLSAQKALQWGTLDLEDQMLPPRKEFFGEKRINPVTERPELHYPWEKRLPAYLLSGAVLLASTAGLLVITLMLFTLRHIMHRDFHSPNAPLYFQFFNAVLVEVLNAQYSRITKWLTDKENHRSEEDYQTHLLGKTMVFKFFNSYVSLYYIAFFKGHDTILGPKLRCRHNDCLVDLSSQLVCFMIVRMILANVWEILWPKMVSFWRGYCEDWATQDLAEGSDVMMFAGMSGMEMQAKKEKAAMYDEMEELLLTYGYCALFVVAAPWMPLVVLLGCGLETALDKTKLFKLYQRPWPVLVGSHEPWDTAFDVVGLLGMFTNLALVVFASDAFSTYTWTEKVTVFFVLENSILAVRAVIATLLPARPVEVQNVHQKHQGLVQKHLDCVETTLDGTMSAFETGAITGRVMVLDRDEDDEEEDF